MSQYHAPLAEMQFVLNELAGLDQVSRLPGFEEATPDVATAILEEASKFATNVLDPLNFSGDQEGAQWRDDGTVKTPAGFKDAYLQFCENGWMGLNKSTDYGGQGLPQLLATPVEEMWHSSNLAFDLCPMLTQGAIEAIESRGSDALKQKFLPNMVAGTWTGTMNLTEPQAGSDLAAVRTRAVPQGDGTYKLYGTKIFITYGEHDYTENIVHLVLARTPDAPPGRQGHLAVRRAEVSRQRRRVARARATTSRACRSSTSSAFIRAPPRSCPTATRAARSVTWWARRIAASNTCSS